MPIIRLNDSPSAFVQMQEMSRRGEAWLKPGSQFLVALLALTALATWSISGAPEAEKWWCYAAASFTLAQIAWWEYVTIFALDEEILAMKQEKHDCKGGDRQDLLGKDGTERLHGLMDQWSLRHSVRATLPLAAGLLALAPKFIRI